jgi:DNA sulfur modification protein DndB
MSDSKKDVVTEGLVDADAMKRLLRDKKSRYVFKTIKKNRLTEHEEEGWEVHKKHKQSYRVKKEKPHDRFFEDRIWCLLAKLDFEHMNKDEKLKISHSDNPGVSPKQIDVLAVDRETVLVVECKSAADVRSKSFQKDIADIKDIKKGVCNTLRKRFAPTYGRDWKPKVAWLFATSNYVVSRPDCARMKEGNIVHLSEDHVEYYEKLVSLLGPVAKYQLFGILFEGQEIPELDVAVPAIKGKAGKYTYYSFAIEPDKLLKISFILHRTDSSSEAFATYQRMVSKSRIRDITRYIDDPKGDGFFPNAVVLNIKSRRPLRFDLASAAKHTSASQLGVLYLPKEYRSAFVIDGQHRLYGYGNSKWRAKHQIPVVAFENLPQEIQTKLFVDINHKQKSVPTNLLLTLMADFHWGSSCDDEAIGAIKVNLLKRLSADPASPLHKRIIITQESKTATRCLTLNYLRGQALDKTNFFGVIEKRKLKDKGYFTGSSCDETVDKAFDFLTRCFDYLRAQLPGQWESGSDAGGFIAMNLGISAIIRVLDDIVRFLATNRGLMPTDLSSEDLAKNVLPYLDPVVSYVDALGTEGTKKLRGYVGGAAVDKVLREFENAINEKYSEFVPDPSFLKWKEASSGKYNEETERRAKEVQRKIRTVVFDLLKKQFGEGGWWIQGVPKKIQQQCAARAIEQDRKEPEDHYLVLLDYLEIIDKQSSLLIHAFTRPGEEQFSKGDKLKWFSRLNEIRNKMAHPEREPATEEDRDYVKSIHDWLCGVT